MRRGNVHAAAERGACGRRCAAAFGTPYFQCAVIGAGNRTAQRCVHAPPERLECVHDILKCGRPHSRRHACAGFLRTVSTLSLGLTTYPWTFPSHKAFVRRKQEHRERVALWRAQLTPVYDVGCAVYSAREVLERHGRIHGREMRWWRRWRWLIACNWTIFS